MNMSSLNTTHQFDVIIVGSGGAGLSLALSLPHHYNIAVLAKAPLTEASTYYAQGGVAAVLDETDSIQQHIDDTMIAGAQLCELDAVKHTVEGGKPSVDFLLKHGVQFTLDDAEQLHLTREGGHSQRRIIHAADATGKAISTTLVQRAQEQKNLTIFENYIAIDLITTEKLGIDEQKNRAVGLYALNEKTGKVHTFLAPFTALACGGAMKAYLYTSNPDIATGDGIAMAYRAGCRVANMEFNQFHPTCLYHPQARSFLITEAMRGEGAYLRLPEGERFMLRFDERAELAPRDIVARAIDFEIKRLGIRHVWLDITHKPAEFVKEHFPTLYTRLLELGIDITKDMIPVVPAAHYTCGGVVVDEHSQTDISGLYAIGETSYTGLHGANRMASNSLLECFVYGMSAAQHIQSQFNPEVSLPAVPEWDDSQVTDADEDVVILQNWDELRQTMWNYVGIVRTSKRLKRALHRIEMLKREITEYYEDYQVSKNLIELRNLVLVSEMIVRCAMERKESRGLHYTLDYLELAPELRKTILTPPDFKVSQPLVNEEVEPALG
ncbi:L-aspartate oxidase [Acinetobacter radioresistens]|jgi:L-aspartate oxidase|uniref:L-aspartate oxidase n=1 Tax=Acinetobacter radioresistens SK82 TaxID=596318 RepID=A0ABM9YKI3_ACIRA|nr:MULTISPECIES: L-aspartate oxidase [Acinetobacter]EET81406.1 L-aspartate oxidase [Acinetobacter radioresistens SK82]EJO34863.1 L-aspartate oxidase [Acinetobacter radioresistens WC-A-157]EXB87312.1 L-aspartate oxidase [Acinetobacter sp. 272263]EXE59060.1 L-aspartate oxidase [Acinetobacter sp. 1239920]EXF56972.1 L-aspartate oxidase [Acinetobacter sp. 1294596]